MLDSSITKWIGERAGDLGFAGCGVVRADRFPEMARNEEWLARGYAGEMKYLGDVRRDDIRHSMPGVQSVIVCALVYNTEHPRTGQAWSNGNNSAYENDEPRGWISRYAWGDDYHNVLRGKLEILLGGLREKWAEPFDARVYADTGPMNERVLAKYAGLGWLGKNTLLLNEQLGSFFFLGTILTSLDLQPSLAPTEFPAADRCGSCRKCIDTCPTTALVEPYVMDARRCISYLTIELRSAIPEDLREAMGRHIFGCDICQDVCPWNRNAPETETMEFAPRTFAQSGVEESLFMPSLEWLGSLSEEEFRVIFRGSPIKRTKWKGLLRNVCNALGNAKFVKGSAAEGRVSQLLSRLASSEEPVIAESAQWAISRIQENEGNSDIRFQARDGIKADMFKI
jgi:epoxyqueuosine reductase